MPEVADSTAAAFAPEDHTLSSLPSPSPSATTAWRSSPLPSLSPSPWPLPLPSPPPAASRHPARSGRSSAGRRRHGRLPWPPERKVGERPRHHRPCGRTALPVTARATARRKRKEGERGRLGHRLPSRPWGGRRESRSASSYKRTTG
uniref:Uncharacterized protein n=1 Tax=Oryza sativa subsp. japonica TaxID=39947 RepID=Q5Z6B0_ORYSJ|nr:hypothetical protein [Oryza sativa Japonica Group]BAD54481.1 hypothetical protein [Oryza sativa Japonica Group]